MKQSRSASFMSSEICISLPEHLSLLCQMMEAAETDMLSSEQVTAA